VKAGDLIRFSRAHWEGAGVDYTRSWIGIIIKKVESSEGREELHILWDHGKVIGYPSSWWLQLSYFPFEVIR
jgi:hypothetical protein